MSDRVKRTDIGARAVKNADILGETTGEDMSEEEEKDLVDEYFSTPAQELKAWKGAIFATIKGGQSYKIGSRSLTRPALEALIAERDKVEQRIAAAEGSDLFPGTFAADFGYDNRR